MITLDFGPERLPLQLATPLLPSPGLWVPRGTLSLRAMGARVTPPLGESWDGDAMPWSAQPGALCWRPAVRPLDRMVGRLQRFASDRPLILTLAPAAPAALAAALDAVNLDEIAACLLWQATPATARAARRVLGPVPLIAESSGGAEAPSSDLVEAGADAIWLGPPRLRDGTRLWGPALLPLMRDEVRAVQPLGVPLVVGAAIASPEAALALRDDGATLFALGPPWWVEPDLTERVLAALG